MVLFIEFVHSIQNDVELFRDSEFIPVCNWHFLGIWRIWIPERFLQVEEADIIRNFNLLSDSTVDVWAEPSCISDCETVNRFNFHLELFSINFSHSLNISERNSVSIVEAMLFVFMEADQSFFLLSDSSDMDEFDLFSSWIMDSVGFSEINEGVSV